MRGPYPGLSKASHSPRMVNLRNKAQNRVSAMVEVERSVAVTLNDSLGAVEEIHTGEMRRYS
jgi:hypothetical protein